MRDLSKPLASTYGDPVKKKKSSLKLMKKKPTPSQDALRRATSKKAPSYDAYGNNTTVQTHMKGKVQQDGYNDAMKKKQASINSLRGVKPKRSTRINGSRIITW